MLLTILLLWCSGTFCGEVSKSIKEYSFEKHREEIVFGELWIFEHETTSALKRKYVYARYR